MKKLIAILLVLMLPVPALADAPAPVDFPDGIRLGMSYAQVAPVLVGEPVMDLTEDNVRFVVYPGYRLCDAECMLAAVFMDDALVMLAAAQAKAEYAAVQELLTARCGEARPMEVADLVAAMSAMAGESMDVTATDVLRWEAEDGTQVWMMMTPAGDVLVMNLSAR